MAEESKGEGLPEVTEGMRERSIQPHTSGSSESKQINLVLASTRMNPPTPGHMRVLEELIMQGIQKETNEVYVVLSKKNDDEYNPMNCKDKIYYLNGFNENEQKNKANFGSYKDDSMVYALKRKMIEKYPDIPQEKINNMKVIFECVDDGQKGPFHKVRDIIQNKLSMRRRGQTLGIYLVVGDDRSETLDNMKKIKINGQKLNENIDISTFEQIVIKREDSGDFQSMSPEVINNKKISPNQISGRLVRKLATDNPEKFLEIYSDYISDDKKRSLLGNINEGLSRISEEMKMRAEDKASRRVMSAEDKASRRAMPAEDKASRRARGLPGRGSVADLEREIKGGRRIRQNIIRKTNSEQKSRRRKKGGVGKQLRRRKTVKNKRKFRKNNNKTKNNKMKNRRQTRKHK